MTTDAQEALKKQIHNSEREIDGLENKIESSDDSTGSPGDYAALRSEQEHHRQDILKRKASLDETIK